MDLHSKGNPRLLDELEDLEVQVVLDVAEAHLEDQVSVVLELVIDFDDAVVLCLETCPGLAQFDILAEYGAFPFDGAGARGTLVATRAIMENLEDFGFEELLVVRLIVFFVVARIGNRRGTSHGHLEPRPKDALELVVTVANRQVTVLVADKEVSRVELGD